MDYKTKDLSGLLPSGIELNTSNVVAARNAINAFFLRGFEMWFQDLQDIALSPAAPYSLEGLSACSDEELNRYLTELDVNFQCVDRDVKIYFIHAAHTYRLGSNDIIDAVTKYALNALTIDTVVGYAACPDNTFRIDVAGDVAGSLQRPEYINRLIAYLNRFNLVTEKLNGISVTQKENIDVVYTGCENNLSSLVSVSSDAPVKVGSNFNLEDGKTLLGFKSPYIWGYSCSMTVETAQWTVYTLNATSELKTGGSVSVSHPCPGPAYSDVVLIDSGGNIILSSSQNEGLTISATKTAGRLFLRVQGEQLTSMTKPNSPSFIVKPNNESPYPVYGSMYFVPTDLYQLVGREVVWNASHPLYVLFLNKSVQPVYA